MDRPCPDDPKTYANHMCVRLTDKDIKIVQIKCKENKSFRTKSALSFLLGQNQNLHLRPKKSCGWWVGGWGGLSKNLVKPWA